MSEMTTPSIERCPLPVGMKPDGIGWQIVGKPEGKNGVVAWERRREELRWPRAVYADLAVIKQIETAIENETDLGVHFDRGNSQYHGEIIGLLQRCKAKIEALEGKLRQGCNMMGPYREMKGRTKQ